MLFWLCADELTHHGELNSAEACAINGLIQIDPGTVGKRGRDAARIAFIDKVTDGHRTLHHREFARVFAALKKHLSTQLVRAATRTNLNGEPVHLNIKFSRGALEEIARGHLYAATPAAVDRPAKPRRNR
jgi:hypothetical protein